MANGIHVPKNCSAETSEKVAIIIPFRDNQVESRSNQLGWLLYYLIPMLVRQNAYFGIYLINQHGSEEPFNRGKLLNVGFTEGKFVQIGMV